MFDGTYGKNLKLTVWGGSHDEKIGMTLDGFPAGEVIDLDALRNLLSRRAPGRNAWSTARKEADEPVFLSGVSDGVTTGGRIEAVIYNTNVRSGDYDNLSDVPRPSHADYPARVKYGEEVDLRGGGHFSGRLTAPLTLAGGICLSALCRRGIRIGAHIFSLGGVKDTPFDPVLVSENDFSRVRQADFPTLDERAGEDMRKIIESARAAGDSVGGIAECAVTGLPVGLGEHLFDGVENRISAIVFGIPAIKGIEFGAGFEGVSTLCGSRFNDPFYTDGKTVRTETNHAGGILGGMTDGMPVLFRVAVKPTPSISLPQKSVSLSRMENVTLCIRGRHDPCILPRVIPVLEAAAAVAVTDLLLDAGHLPPVS